MSEIMEEPVREADAETRQLRRWLAKPAKGVARVEVWAGETRLCQWDDPKPAQAVDIQLAMDEHADAMGETTVFELRQVTSSEVTTARKVLRRARAAPEGPSTFTGDAANLSQQLQSHLQIMMRLHGEQSLAYMKHTNQLTEASTALVEQMGKLLELQQQRTAELMERLHESEDAAMRARSEPESDAANEAQAKVLKMVEAMLPMLLQKMAGTP